MAWSRLLEAGLPGATEISVKSGMFGRRTLRGYSIEWGMKKLQLVGGGPDADIPDYGILAEDGGLYRRDKAGNAPYLRKDHLLSDGVPVSEMVGVKLRQVTAGLAAEHLPR